MVPRIVKSRSQCPISAVFVENVEVLPGTDSKYLTAEIRIPIIVNK